MGGGTDSARDNSETIARAEAVCEAALAGLERSFFVQSLNGAPLERLPEVSIDEANRRTALGRKILRDAEAIDLEALPLETATTLLVARFAAEIWEGEAGRYWHAFDPSELFPGIFSVTAYAFGNTLHMANERLDSFRFQDSADCDRYLSLLDNYAKLVEGAHDRLQGQAERGFRLPQPAIPAARLLLENIIGSLEQSLAVSDSRLSRISDPKQFQRAVETRLSLAVKPALQALRNELSDAYFEAAPEGVGIGQFDGGADVYRDLVRIHLSDGMAPEDVHEAGLQRMSAILAEMASIRRDLGFTGAASEFHETLRTKPPYGAASPEAIEAFFNECRERIETRLPELLSIKPRASHRVARLDPALEGSMTFGFYTPPSPEKPEGVYYFNGLNMSENGSLVSIPSLLYHELVPGHHFHFATQGENDDLHPVRKHTFVNAFNEAWAEYAATLAGEAGLYHTRYEEYGRCLMDAFLTSRLVVDTGMNVMGWGLEKARDYMRKHTMLSESEIASETLRYSCDIPAQALAYKLGDTRILNLRSRVRNALGDRFDLRAFNDFIVGGGAMPLTALDWRIEKFIEQNRAGI